MPFTYIPAHSTTHPDTFISNLTGRVFTVEQDTGAEDPREWVEDETAAIYVFNGPHGETDTKVPENIVTQAFARFYEVFDEDQSFAMITRWLGIFYPDLNVDVAIQTIRGYPQSDWADVFCVVADGHGTAVSHINEYRMWVYGDVWTVSTEGDSSLSGIYANDSEEALKYFLEEKPEHTEPLPPEGEIHLEINNTFVSELSAIVQDPARKTVHLVGERGGMSLITGVSEEPSTSGAIAITTEHGAVHLDPGARIVIFETVIKENQPLFNEQESALETDAETEKKTEPEPAQQEQEQASAETVASEPEPNYVREGISRWHLASGVVVCDTETRNPGVYYYPKEEDQALIEDPRLMAKTLIAAQRTFAQKTRA